MIYTSVILYYELCKTFEIKDPAIEKHKAVRSAMRKGNKALDAMEVINESEAV